MDYTPVLTSRLTLTIGGCLNSDLLFNISSLHLVMRTPSATCRDSGSLYDTDIIVRLVTRVVLLLVIIHERVRFPLLELVLMFESSRVQVSGCFSDICCTALIANIFVGDVRLATSSAASTWLLTNWTFDFLASRTPRGVCILELPSNCLSSTLCFFEL